MHPEYEKEIRRPVKQLHRHYEASDAPLTDPLTIDELADYVRELAHMIATTFLVNQGTLGLDSNDLTTLQYITQRIKEAQG